MLRNFASLFVLLVVSAAGCTIQTATDQNTAGSANTAGSPSDNGGAGDVAGAPSGGGGSAGVEPEGGAGGIDAEGGDTAAGAPSGGAAPVLPKLVNVTLIDALIRPWGSDGKTWDDAEALPDGAVSAVSEAFGVAAPYAAVAEALTKFAYNTYTPPDPKGDAAIVFNGLYNPKYDQVLAVQMDTFQPSWNTMHIIWAGVPLDGTARLQINLVDQDVVNDDMIGTVELNNDDFVAALQAKDAYPVKTAKDLNTDPILFVRISVSAAVTP